MHTLGYKGRAVGARLAAVEYGLQCMARVRSRLFRMPFVHHAYGRPVCRLVLLPVRSTAWASRCACCRDFEIVAHRPSGTGQVTAPPADQSIADGGSCP